MFVGTVSLNLKSPYEFCQWTFNCVDNNEGLATHTSSDAVLLSILRCTTIIYFFVKLKKISKLGSAYVVGGVCVCVAFAALTFAVTLVQLLHKNWGIVGDALPIFLLLIDLSRIVVVIQHTLTANTLSAIEDRIAEAMKKIGPMVTFDTLIEILIIITSSTMKVRQLQEIFCFACLSVLLNYFVFTTFVPACLSLYLMSSQKTTLKPTWYDGRFSKVLEKEWNRETNPLVFRIKMILCCTLLLINGLRIFYGGSIPGTDQLQANFDSVLTLTPQQFFTVTVVMLLFSKFFLNTGKVDDSHPMSKPVKINKHAEIPDPPETLYQEAEEVCPPRSLEVCLQLLKQDSNLLTDQEIMCLVQERKIPNHKLEVALSDPNRGVAIRRYFPLFYICFPCICIYCAVYNFYHPFSFFRNLLSVQLQESKQIALTHIPHSHYDFSKATVACCENTVGYMPVPVGIAGPLLMNEKEYFVPMATTEGTLIASTNRGMKALYQSNGVQTTVYSNGMTRAPVVEFPTAREACEMAQWIQVQYNFELVKDKFDETSRYARLEAILPIVCGRLLFIRFKSSTGDAMGMNMVSKGAEHALRWLQEIHKNMKIISLSGNVCTDKKPSAINWILGRGKSVVAEAVIPASVVSTVLKTNIDTLVHLNFCKNQIGSAMAGSIGGFNAHAANALTAVYIATGQDPAQNVESSNCMTMFEKITPDNKNEEASVLVTCTMPCIEVATTGGGTALDAQRACLNLLGVGGATGQDGSAGDNATNFAQIVCATVLASELSLLSALDAGHLVQSHMKHNRLPNPSTLPSQINHNIL